MLGLITNYIVKSTESTSSNSIGIVQTRYKFKGIDSLKPFQLELRVLIITTSIIGTMPGLMELCKWS